MTAPNSAGRVNWPKYVFFTKDVVEENVERLLGVRPTCAVAEGGILLFGGENGYVHISDRNLTLSDENRHKIFRGAVLGLAYIFDPQYNSKQYIFSVGDDAPRPEDGRPINVVKIFSTLDLTRPLQAFIVNPSIGGDRVTSTVTSFAVLSDGSQIAVGFSTGTASIFVGSFIRETASRTALSNITPQVTLAPQTSPISSLQFCEMPSSAQRPQDRRIFLYVVLDTNVSATGATNPTTGVLSIDMSVTVTSAGVVPCATRRPVATLDEIGADPLCVSYMADTR
jgi:hypothetical protein